MEFDQGRDFGDENQGPGSAPAKPVAPPVDRDIHERALAVLAIYRRENDLLHAKLTKLEDFLQQATMLSVFQAWEERHPRYGAKKAQQGPSCPVTIGV